MKSYGGILKRLRCKNLSISCFNRQGEIVDHDSSTKHRPEMQVFMSPLRSGHLEMIRHPDDPLSSNQGLESRCGVIMFVVGIIVAGGIFYINDYPSSTFTIKPLTKQHNPECALRNMVMKKV